MKLAALLLAALALSLQVPVSAARTHRITSEIHSAPEGAQVLTGDEVPNTTLLPQRLMGVTPLALTYDIAGDCGRTPGVRVRWASGAEASSSAIALCTKTGKRQTFTFERPADVDRLAIDLQVAFQQATLAQLQAQTSALNELDYQAWLLTLNASQRAAAAPKPFARCISRDVARGVIYVACQ